MHVLEINYVNALRIEVHYKVHSWIAMSDNYKYRCVGDSSSSVCMEMFTDEDLSLHECLRATSACLYTLGIKAKSWMGTSTREGWGIMSGTNGKR